MTYDGPRELMNAQLPRSQQRMSIRQRGYIEDLMLQCRMDDGEKMDNRQAMDNMTIPEASKLIDSLKRQLNT